MSAAWIVAAVSSTPSNEEDGRRQLFIVAGLLVGLVLLSFVGYSLFKRWMTSSDSPAEAAGFSLSDLRKMRAEGKISDEEFEKTRGMMVAAAKRMVDGVPRIKPNHPVQPPAVPGPKSEAEPESD
jgi:hypothetical protein